MKNPILEFEGEYRFLSNFFPSSFTVGPPPGSPGRIWTFGTVEHYYQASKTTDPEWFQKIAWAETAGKAKKLGRQCPTRENWEALKDSFMMQGLKYKFQQNKDLLKKLKETGTSLLVEGNRWGDSYWGFDINKGYGQNRLGQMLMIIRLTNGNPQI